MYVEDRWHKKDRTRTADYGKGTRWRARPDNGAPGESFDTKAAAWEYLRTAEPPRSAAVRGDRLVSDYGAEWLAGKHVRKGTHTHMEIKWRLYLQPALGHYRLYELDRAKVQAAVDGWSETLAENTIKTMFSYVHQLITQAVDDGLIEGGHPCKGVNLPQVIKGRVVVLTSDQVQEIADNMEPRYRGLVWLGALSGMRQAEMRGLTVDRVTFGPNDEWVHILVDRQLARKGKRAVPGPRVVSGPTWGPTKGAGRTRDGIRDIVEGPELAAALREHMAKFPPNADGLIFTGRSGRGRARAGRPAPNPFGGTPIAPSTMAGAWNSAAEGVTPDDRREGWHLLRHYHASLLISGGCSAVAVGERLGNDSREVYKTYAHLWPGDDDKVRAATKAAAAALLSGHPRALGRLHVVGTSVT